MRTRSPGAASATRIVRPSAWASPKPPGKMRSIVTSMYDKLSLLIKLSLPEEPKLSLQKENRWIQLSSATVEFVVAPEERDVYSYERTPKNLAPLGAKPGSGTFTGAGNSDCAPTELRSKETT